MSGKLLAYMPTRLLSLLGFILFLSVVCYVCLFQIIDYDVWWHITAGRIMRSTGSLISIDPFSYVREGQVYLATHEWLAQIIISFVYDLFGANGLIIFRTILVTLAFVPIFLINLKRIWIMSPIVAYGAIALRPAILDRPQLFSFVLFSISLFLSSRWLLDKISIRKYAISALVIQILWVNFHGGAALLHLVIIGSVFFQVVWNSIVDGSSIKNIWNESKWIFLLGILLFLTLFLSPSTFHNFSYLTSLFTDKTIDFIQEWAPRESNMYIKWIVPCWVLGFGSLLLFRRSVIFSVTLLLVFGFLSLQAIRHESFFVITALVITVYQLSSINKLDDIFEFFEKKIWPVILYLICIFLIVFCASQSDKYINSIRLGRDGFGSYEPLKGAYEFLENENIEGNMFNNYEAGSYLLYKGYPNRKVFVDGRNIEYGYSFLSDLFASGNSVSKFKKLDEKYEFTYAVIQFDYYKELENLPYISVFEAMSNWDLAYIDDTSAVYIKSNFFPDVFEYKILTPSIVLFPTRILQIPSSLFDQLNQEIDNALDQGSDFLNFRLRLAKASLFFANGDISSAESIILDLIKGEPNRYEPVNLLAMIRVDQKKFGEAGLLFEKAIKLGGGENFIIMDYNFLSSLFERSGDERKARYYRRKANEGHENNLKFTI